MSSKRADAAHTAHPLLFSFWSVPDTAACAIVVGPRTTHTFLCQMKLGTHIYTPFFSVGQPCMWT
jgi:hypothetical protein